MTSNFCASREVGGASHASADPARLCAPVGRRCMCQTFRNFCDATKKFSPKQHRSRVGGGVEGEQMPSTKCLLHDKGQKKKCKQAINPLDICPQFDPKLGRRAVPRRASSASLHCVTRCLPACL